MSPYFARLLQPAVVAPAALSPNPGDNLAVTASADALQEIDLVVEAVQPVEVRPRALSMPTPQAAVHSGSDAEVGKHRAMDDNLATSAQSSSTSASIPKPTPRPAEAARSDTTQLQAAETQPAVHALERAAERDTPPPETPARTTDPAAPLLDEVLRWVAAATQPANAVAPMASTAMNKRPASRLAEFENRQPSFAEQNPAATVQAIHRSSLSLDSHPSGNHPRGKGKAADGELRVEEVVRIAIGDIRVRIEPPTEAPVLALPPNRDVPGAGHGTPIPDSGGLRRRCIHL